MFTFLHHLSHVLNASFVFFAPPQCKCAYYKRNDAFPSWPKYQLREIERIFWRCIRYVILNGLRLSFSAKQGRANCCYEDERKTVYFGNLYESFSARCPAEKSCIQISVFWGCTPCSVMRPPPPKKNTSASVWIKLLPWRQREHAAQKRGNKHIPQCEHQQNHHFE